MAEQESGHNSSESSDEDDPVVKEIDVYLSHHLKDNLYLMMYPVRSTRMPYADTSCMKARIKPKQQKVELEVAVDTEKNYCTNKGEDMARAVNESNSLKGNNQTFYNRLTLFYSSVMDKQVLASMKAENNDRYAVGIMKNNALHVTPVQAMLQLRPSFDYINMAESANGTGKLDNSNSGIVKSDSEEEEDIKPVRYAVPESDQAKAYRISSHAYLEKKNAEEQWIEAEFVGRDDTRATVERELLTNGNMDEITCDYGISAKGYLDALMPPPPAEVSVSVNPENVLSITQLKTMSLPEQIKSILLSAKAMQFSQLGTILSKPSDIDDTAIIQYLQQVAVLVQGCWIVKSELLYPKGTTSPITGIPSDMLCLARDYLLWKFTQTRITSRKEISMVVKLPSEDLKEIMTQVALLRVTKGWEFCLPYDYQFIERYPDVAQRQVQYWEKKYQQLKLRLKLPTQPTGVQSETVQDKKPVMGKDKAIISGQERIKMAKKLAAKHVNANSSSVDGPSNSKIKINVPDGAIAQQSNFNSSDDIKIKDEPMDVDESVAETTDRMNELKQAENDDNNNTSAVPDELIVVVKNWLCEIFDRSIYSLETLKRRLLLYQGTLKEDHIMAKGVSDNTLKRCLKEIGVTELEHQPLSPNETPSKLYVKRKLNESNDKYREVLLDLFKDKAKLRRREIVLAMVEKTGEAPNDKQYLKIVKDVCANKGSMWFLNPLQH
ncbi:DNA-directed RNA polymerase III subunit RPC5 [Trichoplax sp. H2]|nr:DNA-directed RNA polymerase III subunit RPC5 [Trichoplax sp. H2]|eukprot:RDD44005.1 DNA-directed RNA polymerase III subunit RPC5 [Trichoplax sp. H2]